MLDSVSVYPRDAQGLLSTAPLKTISLVHTYFDHGATDNDFGDPTYASKRLKLTQVLEKGYYGGTLVQNSPYKFTYYEGGALNSSIKKLIRKGPLELLQRKHQQHFSCPKQNPNKFS